MTAGRGAGRSRGDGRDGEETLRRHALVLAGGAGLSTFGMGLLTPILPGYVLALGGSATLVGLLLAGFGLARLLVSLPAVWLAGRVESRRLLIGGLAITAPVAALCALAGGVWVLALFCASEGMAAALYMTVATATLVGEAGPQQRGRALGGYQTAALLGSSLGPAVGGLVGQQFGPRVVFLLYAALAAAGALWLHGRLDRQTAPRPQTAPRLDTAPTAPPSAPGSVWRTLAAPRLLPLWLVAFTLVFGRVGVQLTAAPLLGTRRLGLSAGEIGLALSLIGVTALVAFYPAGWLADRYGRKAVIVLGGLAMVAGLALFAASVGYATFVAAAALLGLGSGVAGPSTTAYLADVVPSDGRTLGVGVTRTLGDAGATVAPPLLGWLVDRAGAGAAPLLAAVALLAAVGAFTWLAPRDRTGRCTRAQAAQTPLDETTRA